MTTEQVNSEQKMKTLEEQLLEVINYNIHDEFDSRKSMTAKRCAEIARDHSRTFAEWIGKNNWWIYGGHVGNKKPTWITKRERLGNAKSTEELLKKFESEK